MRTRGRLHISLRVPPLTTEVLAQLILPAAIVARQAWNMRRDIAVKGGADTFANRGGVPKPKHQRGDPTLLDSAPLRRMIERHVDDTMVRRIAEEYKKGRLLFVLTTNLDQARPVIWNIGAIAASRSPKARDLIIDVLLASASMPAIFPPVMIDVSVNGREYQEMHVDGGTIAQAFLYPPSFSLKQMAALAKMSVRKFRARRKRIAYIIRNGRLSRPQQTVKLKTLAIAKEAISTMIASSGVNDTYRMYLITKRDGVQFNLASIGDDFTIPYKGPFNEGYMRALFNYGYQKASAGYPWQKTPPGYAK